MPREYRHIKEYEKEIIEMFNQGKTKREIAEKLGFTYEQIKGFKHRFNVKQRQIETGTALKRKGRPTKSENGVPPSIQKLDKIAQLKYEIACKDRKIKSLEAENELMRDFLSHTERK